MYAHSHSHLFFYLLHGAQKVKVMSQLTFNLQTHYTVKAHKQHKGIILQNIPVNFGQELRENHVHDGSESWQKKAQVNREKSAQPEISRESCFARTAASVSLRQP